MHYNFFCYLFWIVTLIIFYYLRLHYVRLGECLSQTVALCDVGWMFMSWIFCVDNIWYCSYFVSCLFVLLILLVCLWKRVVFGCTFHNLKNWNISRVDPSGLWHMLGLGSNLITHSSVGAGWPNSVICIGPSSEAGMGRVSPFDTSTCEPSSKTLVSSPSSTKDGWFRINFSPQITPLNHFSPSILFK